MPEPLTAPVIADDVLAAVAEGRHHDPHSVLGQHGFEEPHLAGPLTAIRTRRPLAESVDAVFPDGTELALEHAGHGIWSGAGAFGPRDYRVRARYADRSEWTSDDPYRFAPTIGELDLHLIGEGRHEELWRVLGAHYRPKSQQGTALGLNAGLGNLGVSVMQFCVPLVITFGVFGFMGGKSQALPDGGQLWLQNAGFIWVPFIVLVTVLAWFGMNDLSSARASFSEQAVIFKRKHNGSNAAA